MQIWVDADACPNVVKEILYKAAKRTGTQLTLVANCYLKVPSSPHINKIQVASGFDVADNEIVQRLNAGDLVITSDIPLAAEVIEKGGHALNNRGEFFSPETIKQKLTMRDFMEEMRGSGEVLGGPPAYSHSDRMTFANQLDKFLAQNKKPPLD